MQHRELFRWTFAASGLWLIISPFLLLSGTPTFGQGPTRDIGILMISGMLALIIASLGSGKYDMIRNFSGAVLGFVLVLTPLYATFAEDVSNWNAVIVGAALVLMSLFEVYQSEKWHNNF